MSTNSPNRGGTGPKVTKQGKSGPIVGKMTSLAGTQRPFRMDKGSNKSSFVKGAKNSGNKRSK